ncbi:unnamed protein product [Ixodes hexagonus]
MPSEPRGACNESIFVCAYEGCDATFTKGTRLNWHMRVHTNERPLECTFAGCSKKYTRPYHLTRHVKAAHTQKAATQAESPENLKCPHEECGKQFSSKHTLYKHVNISHKKRQFKAMGDGSLALFFQCEHCPKAFIKHQHLKIHTYEHTKVLPYPCPEPGCDKAFLLPSRLKGHQRSHKGSYKCTMDGCAQVFLKWSLLRKHRKVDHQKSFSCPYCDRVFYSKSSVESHLETHKSEREMFCCPHEGCSRFYLQERNLRDHMRKAHENKRFACDVPGCSRTFFARQTLRRHKVCHDPNRPLPPKKRNKNTTKRRKINIPTKSAAAILSGHAASSKEEKKLLGRNPLDEPDSGPDTELDTESGTDMEVETQPGTATKPHPDKEVQPYPESMTETEEDSDAIAEPRPEPKTETEDDSDAIPEQHPEPNTEAGLQLESPNQVILLENEEPLVAEVIPQCSDISDGCKVILSVTVCSG